MQKYIRIFELLVTSTMLFTTVSMAFFAGLASAHAYRPQHFHHRRQYNGTSYSVAATNPTGGELTSLAVPLSTGNSGPAPTGSAAGEGSVVLTYTLGAGTSTTVVTTTIRHSSTATVYATLPGASEDRAAATGGAAGVGGNDGAVDSDLTTTYTGTSTSTKYVSIFLLLSYSCIV